MEFTKSLRELRDAGSSELATLAKSRSLAKLAWRTDAVYEGLTLKAGNTAAAARNVNNIVYLGLKAD